MKRRDHKDDLICQLRLELSAQEEQMGAMSRGALQAQERLDEMAHDKRVLEARYDLMRLKMEHYQKRHPLDFDECSLCPVHVEVRRSPDDGPYGVATIRTYFHHGASPIAETRANPRDVTVK